MNDASGYGGAGGFGGAFGGMHGMGGGGRSGVGQGTPGQMVRTVMFYSSTVPPDSGSKVEFFVVGFHGDSSPSSQVRMRCALFLLRLLVKIVT